MARMWWVSIGVGLSVVGCIGSAEPGFDADGTSSEPDVAQEIVSCPDGCSADNACRADGEVNPQNVCEVCDVTRDRRGWSAVTGDKACDDGDNCTGAGTCSGGLCTRGAPTDACAVTAECVESCDAQCNLVVKQRTCFIDGVCYAAGDADPNDACRACQPARNQLNWSGTNSDCDDGDGCTYDDRCTANGCMGVLNTCDDGRECTSDFCDGGVCQHPITDGCLVASGCVAENESEPDAPCLVCRPDTSRTTLVVVADAACDDGDTCTTVSTCQADGRCVGNVASIDVEPNDTLTNARDVGVADGGDFPEGEFPGNLRTRDDVDVFRWGMPFEVDGLVFSPRAAITTTMPVELCVFATCGQSSQAAFAPQLTCPANTSKEFLDELTPGCCKSVGDGQGTVQLEAVCISVTAGFGYARVQAAGELDAAACGGYELKWGVGR